MSPEIQTIAALVIAAAAAAWLIVRAVRKSRNPGCGTDCGAVSPDVKRLQARIRRIK